MKICSHCHTENENDFIFCKNCGAEISTCANYGEEKKNSRFQYKNYYDACVQNEFDGVSGEEIKAYIGKNYLSYLTKFSAMQVKNSKISFCIPVFVLTFLLGFIGGALWFMYRKMYKMGIILLAAGIVLSMISVGLNRGNLSSQFGTGLTGSLLEENSIDNPDVLPKNGTNSQNTAYAQKIFERFDSLLENIVGSVVISMFALYLYKKKAIKDIKHLKENAVFTNANDEMFKIAMSGGTNSGAVILSIAAVILITAVFYVILVNPLNQLLFAL